MLYRQCFSLIIYLSMSLLFACAGPPAKQAIDMSLFELEEIQSDQYTLHYAKTGDENNIPVVFIHGTPGDWTSFSDIMQTQSMQDNYLMYSIDRLGWGASVTQDKQVRAEFKPHTDSINALLEKIYQQTQQQIIIVGHSLGGSLAPMVGIASSDYVRGIVVIAGDIDPKFGDPRWYNSLADLWLVRLLLPEALKKANDEIMPLRQELENMNKRLTEIKVPVTIIHGTKDKLVSYDNVDYAKKAFAHLDEQLQIESIQDAGHFVIWEHIPTVIDSINKMAIE